MLSQAGSCPLFSFRRRHPGKPVTRRVDSTAAQSSVHLPPAIHETHHELGARLAARLVAGRSRECAAADEKKRGDTFAAAAVAYVQVD